MTRVARVIGPVEGEATFGICREKRSYIDLYNIFRSQKLCTKTMVNIGMCTIFTTKNGLEDVCCILAAENMSELDH